MRNFLIFLLFATANAMSQSATTICGKIVNENGDAVEYATVGSVKSGKGTLSDSEGTFTLKIPQESNDTLHFSHVSYEDVKVPLSELEENGASIVMPARELDEVVVYSGKRKNAKLVGKGVGVPGAVTSFTPANLGQEVGSIVETEKPFEVQEISFRTKSNGINEALLSINIYSLDAEKGVFTNIMNRPIYVEIPTGEKKQEFTVKPQELLLLDPGSYFVSVKFVDCDKNLKENWSKSDEWDNRKRYEMSKQSIHFPLYMKGSYIRKGVLEPLEEVPVNIGLKVKGVEYR